MNTNSENQDGQESRPHNKVLPKAGLNGFDWTFVQSSTFVLRLNFSAKNPRLRQYPNRYVQCCQRGYKNQNFSKIELNKKNKLYKILLSHHKFILFSSRFFANAHQHICKKPAQFPPHILQKS